MTTFHDVYYLPPEVIEKILNKLDPDSFITCRRVCKSWRDIINRLSKIPSSACHFSDELQTVYMFKDSNIWEQMCRNYLDWRIQTIFMKGAMSWFSVYYNWCLWKNINLSRITKLKLEGLDSPPIRNISTSRDGKICITMKDKVVILDINSLITDEIIGGRYLRFYRDEQIVVIHLDNNSLNLKAISEYSEQIVIDNVEIFGFGDGACYYITFDQKLCKCTLRSDNTFNRPEILSRWYHSDTIMLFHFHHGNVYLLTRSGKLLQYINQRLVQIGSFDWPRYQFATREVFHLFDGNNLIYSNNAYFFVSIENGASLRKYALEMEVTTILLHGNILFIGTYWGEIKLYYVCEICNLLTLDLKDPLYQYILPNEDSKPILGFDISEEHGCHNLFVHTRNNVLLIQFKHSEETGIDVIM